MLERAVVLLRFDKLGFSDALDIALVAALIYFTFKAVRGTRAAQMLLGMVLILAAFQLTGRLELLTLHQILGYAIQYVPFIVIVVFQAEIRRALTALGRYPLLRWVYPVRTTEDVFGEIVYAMTALSSQRIGALVVLERQDRLKQYVEAGIRLDALLSYDLLLSIFNPEAPLHDGAVIVREGRIAAAGCFLPLTLQPELSKAYGTRHRAAIGIAEESDAVAVVVSEETGHIALAVAGRVETDLSAEQLHSRLRDLFAQGPSRPAEKVADAAGA